MRLALALGKSVRELLACCDSRELSAWIVFDGLYLLPDGLGRPRGPVGPVTGEAQKAVWRGLAARQGGGA